MDSLFSLLRSIASMSDLLVAHLQRILEPYHYRRGTILLREGETAREIFFIEKGLVRSFHLLEGLEVSNWFMKEGDICVSVLSFFRQRPSTDWIMALEDCDVWGISYDELEETYALFPEFNQHGLRILTEYYIRSELRHQDTRRQTAMAKYLTLLKNHPELARRVPKIYLATYLNVSHRTFCRIQRRVAREKRGGE